MKDYEERRIARAGQKVFSGNFQELDENLDTEFFPSEPRDPVEYANWKNCMFTTSMFREIVKRLQAFGLINLTIDHSKLTDNACISHQNLFDFIDLRNAFYNNEIYKAQQKYILRKKTEHEMKDGK